MTPYQNAWYIISQLHGHPLDQNKFQDLDAFAKFTIKRTAIILIGFVIASCPSQPVTDESMPSTSAVIYWQNTLQVISNIQL